MSAETTYPGGCHCGAVQFEVTMALTGVMACNCSMCSKRGALLAFAPAAAFTLTKGAGATTVYRFNKHAIDHHFCTTCGIASFSRGVFKTDAKVMINVRCLDGVDADALPVKHVDGRSF